MLKGARKGIDWLIGRRTSFSPPKPPGVDEAAQLRNALARWHAGAAERFARLFVHGKPLFVARRERELFADLAATGLIEKLGPAIYQPRVRLLPLYGRFLATDLLSHNAADQVFTLMFEQVYFVRNVSVEANDDVLELCLGSAVNALFAADAARSVTGVDVSERALAFSRFNEALNPGSVPIERVHGSLFEPLEPGRRFDVILVNPPFELVPAEEDWYLHSDGGEDGLDVVRHILRDLPGRLTPGGRFEIITWSPGATSGPLLVDLLREALPAHRLSVHVLDVQPIDTHVETFSESEHFPAFRERLEARGLNEVYFLYVRAAPATTPGVEILTPEREITACHEIADRWLT